MSIIYTVIIRFLLHIQMYPISSFQNIYIKFDLLRGSILRHDIYIFWLISIHVNFEDSYFGLSQRQNVSSNFENVSTSTIIIYVNLKAILKAKISQHQMSRFAFLFLSILYNLFTCNIHFYIFNIFRDISPRTSFKSSTFLIIYKTNGITLNDNSNGKRLVEIQIIRRITQIKFRSKKWSSCKQEFRRKLGSLISLIFDDRLMQSKGRMSGKFNELKIEDRYAQRKREKGVIKHFARLTEGFLLAKQEDSKGARRDSRRMPRTKVVGERCCG